MSCCTCGKQRNIILDYNAINPVSVLHVRDEVLLPFRYQPKTLITKANLSL